MSVSSARVNFRVKGVLELVIKTVSETAYKISTEDIPDLIKNK
jgi:hypothetical protein